MTRNTARLARIAGGLLAGSLVLTGCSDEAGNSGAGNAPDVGSSVTGATDVNDTDVAFARGMVPHHEGALSMAQVAVDRATDPRVVELAERIEAGQDPEIDLMTGWLEDWGQSLESDSGGMGDMDHGSQGMGDMDMGDMDMGDMPAGPDFDRMWLQAMIEHHQGAVEMSQTEVEDGRNAEAIELARLISETQTQEIEEMQQLLTEIAG